MSAPLLGLGIGWRPATTTLMLRRADLGFAEVVAEHVTSTSQLPLALEAARGRGLVIVPHGLKLSLGSAEPPSAKRLGRLGDLATRLGTPLVAEHAAFVRRGRRDIGHLTPLPRTRDALSVLVENTRIAEDALPVPLALENAAALFAWPDDELDEGAFLTELVERSGCLLLLDLANLYVSAANRGVDPIATLDRLPLDRIAYVHVAGGVARDGLLHDTHAHALWPAVERLVEELAARTPIPGVLLERDDRFPPMRELNAELDRIRQAWERGNGAPRMSVPGPGGDVAMPPVDAARTRLHLAQRSLADALAAGGAVPPGFDEDRVAAATEALAKKRARERPVQRRRVSRWAGRVAAAADRRSARSDG